MKVALQPELGWDHCAVFTLQQQCVGEEGSVTEPGWCSAGTWYDTEIRELKDQGRK